MTSVRDYLLCTQSALHSVQTHGRAVLAAWGEAWLPQDRGAAAGVANGLRCDCQPMEPPSDSAARGDWWDSRGPWGCVWLHSEAATAFATLAFGMRSVSAGSLAADVGAQMARALLQALSGASASPVAVPGLPAQATEPGRQAMRMNVRVDDWTVALVVQPAASLTPVLHSSDAAPPSRLDQALAGQALPLAVRLGEAEIELGALQDLAVGDVLRLERRLDEPAELLLFEQPLACRAYLGAQDGHAAVEIAR